MATRHRSLKTLMVGICAALAAVVPASGAMAATQANYDLSYCSSGTYEGSAYSDAQNGRLSVGWCSNSSGTKATTITVKYTKQLGTNIRATFGYEWADSSGTNSGGRHWDTTGAVTIQASQTWGARFKRNPAESRPSSSLKCVRGLMKVGSKAVIYSTRVKCP